MPAHTQIDATLALTVDAADYSCQFLTTSLTLPASAPAEVQKVACGDDVAIASTEQRTGALTGEVLKDTSAAGITRALAGMLDGQPRPYTYTEAAGTADEFAITGTLTVDPLSVDFGPGGTGRHRVSFAIQTATLAPAS